MAGDATAVISGRNFLAYSKAWASGNAMPADTVDYGAAITGFTDRGYTTGGLGFSMGLTRGEIRVDQEFDPVVTPITARSIKLTSSLAEFTPDNMQLASGVGAVTTTAPASGVRGYTDLTIGNTLSESYNSWLFDIEKPDEEALRILIYKGIATGSPSPKFTATDAAAIDLEITALVDTSSDPSRIALVHDVIAALA